MKKTTALLLLLASAAIAQPRKYQSLLWEISGNGLPKKSYLYGSMHVSEKVSYHLSDAFFKHLLASDYVANESDPSTWIDLYDVMGGSSVKTILDSEKPFYSRFCQSPAKREDLYPIFASDNTTLNNLLFRTNETQKDFQEDTYLDMFIYQTGKKYRKQVVGLEDAKTSMISILNAESGDMDPKEENLQAIAKLLRERSFNQALLDYYRDKNLDMLDSLYTLATPGKYLKALIYDRNQVMAKSIDSIARKGSLFAAIGAAHLPGRSGVIELLRQKGYTVVPVVDAYTEKGRAIKKQIDEYFIKPQFGMRATADGMIRLPMHAQPIYNDDDIGTPDLSNGGIVTLKRIPLRDYLRTDGSIFSPQTLDSLFYENIPGDILEKKFLHEGSYPAFDIRNRTKTGNAQHYKYFITPLEIVCVSMSGSGNYVRQYENEIFGNIRIRKYASGRQTVSPAKGGFSIEAPAYYTLYGNRASGNPTDVELNAWDENEKAWYFLIERTLVDNSTLEDTAFELKRIQDEFYTQSNALATSTQVSASADSYESAAEIGKRRIRLKTIVHGQKYYLLGTANASEENTSKYFASFKIKPYDYTAATRTFTDSAAHFRIEVPAKENEKLFWNLKPRPGFTDNESRKKNIFQTADKEFLFRSPSGISAGLSAWQAHRYDYSKNRDSLLVSLRKSIIADFDGYQEDEEDFEDAIDAEMAFADSIPKSEVPFSNWDAVFGPFSESAKKRSAIRLTGEKQSFDAARSLHRYDVLATRANSAQAIKYTTFWRDGYFWWLRTLVPKDYGSDDAFIERIASSFEPLADLPEHSIYDKKTQLFFSDARSQTDSIRYSALQSVRAVDFEKEDLPELTAFLENFDFRPDETAALEYLIEKTGRICDANAIAFLDRFYRRENNPTGVQLAVLRALTHQKSKAAYRKILELLEQDLPLSDNEYEIRNLFTRFASDPENSKALFPGIFQFYGVREYHGPIVSFATTLFDAGLVNPKKLRSYRKLLLTDARLEYKRVSGWKAKDAAKMVEARDYFETDPSERLREYCTLLYALRKDKTVAALFGKVRQLGMARIDMEIARLALENNERIAQDSMDKLLTDSQTCFTALRMLYDSKRLDGIPNEEEIAVSAITQFGGLGTDASQIGFLGKRVVPLDGKSFTIFFFRSDEKPPGIFPAEANLSAVAFANGPEGINPQAWKIVRSGGSTDAADLEEEFEAIIDRLVNGAHARATFGKQKNAVLAPFLEEEF